MRDFVNLKNKRMEIFQKGNFGTPILILTGMGCSFDEWVEVTEALSKTNRVIMFHRPGLGDSEIGEGIRTTDSTIGEIYRLLTMLEITEPVVLIGHSYGGLCAQHFTKVYPHKVKALVLVDSTSHDLEKLNTLDLPVLNQNSSDKEWLESCKIYADLNEKELSKIVQPILTENQKKLPLPVQERLIKFQQKPDLYKAMKSEAENWKADAKIIKELGPFPDTPLLVIGRDKEYVIQQGIEEGIPESELQLLENTWQQLIKEQAKLSKKSRLVFAKQSGHSMHLDRPDFMIATIQEISKDINLN
ncbi:alpha/beta hydrolase [Planococcus salinarum]|uniref:alpha/beta hydrolase n=1 Tax=Planococcus salinarum TaxID=622695 RepID=UPI000E3CD2B2|nr:alpha/beta hydrolase [Planococcus salinarum]TAA66096.1 alpha/beta hydrolase [Planococcus salinarum]